MHPRFSHAGKRYTLAVVIECLENIIELGKSAYVVAKEFVMCHKTPRRWFRGFSRQNEIAKWACFFHGDLPRDSTEFAPLLLKQFRLMGNGDLAAGTSLAMVRLHEEFSCGLY